MCSRAFLGLTCFTVTVLVVLFGVQAAENYFHPPGATAESPDNVDSNAVVMEYIPMDIKADILEKQKYQYMLETNEISDERRLPSGFQFHPLMNGCATAQYTYGCCYIFPEVNFPICFNVTYLARDYGLNITVQIGSAIFNEEVSLRNPPPLCLDTDILIPYKLGKLCVRIHDIDVTAAHVHFCAKLLVEVLIKSVYTKELGCVEIPIKESDLLQHQKWLQLQ